MIFCFVSVVRCWKRKTSDYVTSIRRVEWLLCFTWLISCLVVGYTVLRPPANRTKGLGINQLRGNVDWLM